MPHVLDTLSRTESLLDSMLALVAESGLEAPSSRRIAARTRLSMGTLAHHYGARRRLIEVLCHRLVLRFRVLVTGSVAVRGPAGLMVDPAEPESVVLHRAWVALQELGQSSENVARSLSLCDAHDRDIVTRLLGPASPGDVDTMLALVLGLRLLTSRTYGAMPVAAATEILVQHLAAQGGT